MDDGIRIAIDGPASSGKGTVARGVARQLGYAYIDTGAMFRAVALAAEDAGIDWHDEESISALVAELDVGFQWSEGTVEMVVDGRAIAHRIRGERIGGGASAVARYPGVRSALLDLQRSLAQRGGVVMDGRDIGSVVLPEAELKVYLDASVDTRAKRRFDEMRRKDPHVTYEAIKAEIQARDAPDLNRTQAPLVRVADAVYVDTSNMTVDQAVEKILLAAAPRI